MSDCKVCASRHDLFKAGDLVRALHDMPFPRESIVANHAYTVLAADVDDGVGMVQVNTDGQWLLACNFHRTSSLKSIAELASERADVALPAEVER